MFDFLDRLREKPEEYRRMVALAIVGVVGGGIFIVWISATLSRIPDAGQEFAGVSEELGQDIKKEKIKFEDNFAALKGFTSSLRDILTTTVENVQSLQSPIEYQAGE